MESPEHGVLFGPVSFQAQQLVGTTRHTAATTLTTLGIYLHRNSLNRPRTKKGSSREPISCLSQPAAFSQVCMNTLGGERHFNLGSLAHVFQLGRSGRHFTFADNQHILGVELVGAPHLAL